MCEGSKSSMGLSFCNVYQELQFFLPLVDLFSDELVNKLLRAKRGAEMGSALRNDINLCVMEDLRFDQERVLGY